MATQEAARGTPSTRDLDGRATQPTNTSEDETDPPWVSNRDWVRNASDIARHAGKQTSETIRFADTKAAFIMTLFGLLVTSLAKSLDWQRYLVRTISWSAPETIVLHVIAWLFILNSLLVMYRGILVVKPRMTHKAESGLLFWTNVLAYGSPAEYSRAFMAESDVSLLRNVVEQNYYLGQVADNKFHALNRLYLQFGFTLLLGGLTLLAVR